MIFGPQARRTGPTAWLLTALGCLLALSGHADLWRTAYYPGWEQAGMPAAAIDFAALTHLVHFSVVPNPDGTLDDTANGLTPANSADVIARAHAAGVKVLLCVGGSESETGFQGAASPARLPAFINNLTNFVAARGYDGVDVDWEALPVPDAGEYTNLVIALRAALNALAPPRLLTAAVSAYPVYGDPPAAEYQMFAALQSCFDQVNIMTYDFSGPYQGWVTWFNSPIYDRGFRFPSSGSLVPSVDGSVSNFLNYGMTPSRLGIGIAFYGYVWTGGSSTSPDSLTQPRQAWTSAPVTTTCPYTTLMSQYYRSSGYHWDTNAQAAYLSLTNVPATKDDFVSFDDSRTCQAKVSYARNHGLGGVMMWELAGDHTPNQPDPLLQAVKQAIATPGQTNIQPLGNDISLTFTSIALGIYQVQWRSNLASGLWYPLLTTNITGLGGPLEIIDFGARSNQFGRFYRVQTPP
jgi:chitinase